jgi:2-oxoisovalerate dehydrogenase E1 component
VKREGSDITFVSWGPVVHDCLKGGRAACRGEQRLGGGDRPAQPGAARHRDGDPLGAEDGRCVVASAAVHIGSFTGEIASTVQQMAFDYLDAPVLRVGAKNGIAPQSHVLEAGVPAQRR